MELAINSGCNTKRKTDARKFPQDLDEDDFRRFKHCIFNFILAEETKREKSPPKERQTKKRKKTDSVEKESAAQMLRELEKICEGDHNCQDVFVGSLNFDE